MLHVALRDPAHQRPRGRRAGRAARRPRGARPDGRLRRPGAQRRVDRAHRRADPGRRQHRHRRLRPRPGDGLPGAARLLRPVADLPVRLQHRPDRPRRGHPRPRPGDHAVHRRVQDLHHPGDADQRDRGPPLAARGAGRRRDGRRQALRRRLHQRGEGRRVRHRHREHVRLLGLGRRPLLVHVGHRPLAHGRDRAATHYREMLDGFHTVDEHFRTAPYEENLPALLGPDLALVHRLLRRADAGGAAVLAVPGPLPRLPAAAVHGVQRQVGDPRRLAGRRRHRRDRLGRAGHQRPARLLPAAAPGHGARAGRLHRLRAAQPRPRRHARPVPRPTSSPSRARWPSAGRPRRSPPRARRRPSCRTR